MLAFEMYGIGTSQDALQTYFVLVRKNEDGTYFDREDGTFKRYEDLVDGEFTLTEDAHVCGRWFAEIPVPGDGIFTVLPHDGLSRWLVPGSVKQVLLRNGVPAISLELSVRLLDHSYGAPDALRVLGDNGVPVAGATVRVFEKTDYAASKFNRSVGITYTDSAGRWINAIPVNVGTSYVVHYHKEAVFGPKHLDIIVS